MQEGYDLTLGTSERGHQTIDDEGFALPSEYATHCTCTL